MKFRLLFILWFFILNYQASSYAMSMVESSIVDSMYNTIIEDKNFLTAAPNATSAINSAIVKINNNPEISANEKLAAIQLLLSKIALSFGDEQVFTTAVEASIAPPRVKAFIANTSKHKLPPEDPISISP